MTPKEFVEKAVEGGWNGKGILFNIGGEDTVRYMEGFSLREAKERIALKHVSPSDKIKLDSSNSHKDFLIVLLDPKAWEAVGKAKKWGIDYQNGLHTHIIIAHGLIDALFHDMTIEEFLATL